MGKKSAELSCKQKNSAEYKNFAVKIQLITKNFGWAVEPKLKRLPTWIIVVHFFDVTKPASICNHKKFRNHENDSLQITR